jgi:hypothetical protein
MTEQEFKARELVIKFQFQNPPLMFDHAKKLALICVDEILSAFRENLNIDSDYWTEVKSKIEKL